MKFVKIEWREEPRGFHLNAMEYCRILPAIASQLPDGARQFAMDPEHYNFGGSRCVKDLKLSLIAVAGRDPSGLSLKISFHPNVFKHDASLTVKYSGVESFETTINYGSDAFDSVQLDEVLPHDHGCSHEIALIGGRILVVCRDLAANWDGE